MCLNVIDFCEDQPTTHRKEGNHRKDQELCDSRLISVWYVFLEVHPDACGVAAVSSNAAVKLRVQKKRIKSVVDEGGKAAIVGENVGGIAPKEKTEIDNTNHLTRKADSKDSSDPQPSK